MTGLEEIEQFMAAGTRPPMMDLFDIDLLEAEEGKVVFVATPTSQTYNFMGIAHGGYAATLLDSACGIAANSAAQVPINCVTLELKVAYHAPLTDRVGMVRAIGQVVSMYIDDRFVTPEGRVDTGAMRPIMRGGYFDYFTVESENRFEMRRPAGGGTQVPQYRSR